MPPELLSILIQIPIVGIFIWYNDKKDKQFQDFLEKQRKEFTDELKAIRSELSIHDNKLDKHDSKTDQAIAKMEERTRPRAMAGAD
jgi:Skp family chaperone for outer membrane proteins